MGRDSQSGRGQTAGQHTDRDIADRMGARQDGRLQTSALNRLHRQAPAQCQWQAPETYAARTLLGWHAAACELKPALPKAKEAAPGLRRPPNGTRAGDKKALVLKNGRTRVRPDRVLSARWSQLKVSGRSFQCGINTA